MGSYPSRTRSYAKPPGAGYAVRLLAALTLLTGVVGNASATPGYAQTTSPAPPGQFVIESVRVARSAYKYDPNPVVTTYTKGPWPKRFTKNERRSYAPDPPNPTIPSWAFEYSAELVVKYPVSGSLNDQFIVSARANYNRYEYLSQPRTRADKYMESGFDCSAWSVESCGLAQDYDTDYAIKERYAFRQSLSRVGCSGQPQVGGNLSPSIGFWFYAGDEYNGPHDALFDIRVFYKKSSVAPATSGGCCGAEGNPYATEAAGAVNVPRASCPVVDFTITRIEVVQAVQDLEQSVKLVAGKDTLVRAFLACNCAAGTAPLVGGRLTGPLGTLDALPIWPPKPQQFLDEQRQDLDLTLNFLIKDEAWLTAGLKNFEVEVNHDRRILETNFDNNKMSIPRQFRESPSLTIGYILIPYSPPGAAPGAPPIAPDTGIAATAGDLVKEIFPAGNNKLTYIDLSSRLKPKVYSGPLDSREDWSSFIAKLNRSYRSIKGGRPDQLVAWLPGIPGDFISGIPTGRPDTAAISPDRKRVVAYRTTPPSSRAVYYARGAVYYARALAREIGSNLGLKMAPMPTPNPFLSELQCIGGYSVDPGWPADYAPGLINGMGFSSASYFIIQADNYDFMTYCPGGAWTSPYHFNQLFDSGLKAASGHKPNKEAASALDYLLITGSARQDGSTGQLDPGYRMVSDDPAPASNPSGTHCLRFTNGSGDVLSDYCFSLSFLDDDGTTLAEKAFFLQVPFPAGATRLALRQGTKELAAISAGLSSPLVTITSPLGGETWSGTHAIQWNAVNPGGGVLTYGVEFSPDNGLSWYPLDLDLTTTTYSVDASQLAGGPNTRFRVLATNGLQMGTAEVGPIAIPTKGPQAAIVAPASGASFGIGAEVQLQGVGTDIEDTTMPEAAFTWTSNRDGDIGFGRSPLVTLSEGVHEITLTVKDSENKTATATSSITVEQWKVIMPVVRR